MLFGVCGLMPDMVRAVPVWIDDANIQKALFNNVLERSGDRKMESPLLYLRDSSTFGGPSQSAASSPRGLTAAKPSQAHAATSMASGSAHAAADTDGSLGIGVAGWQAKLAERFYNNGVVYKCQVNICWVLDVSYSAGDVRSHTEILDERNTG